MGIGVATLAVAKLALEGATIPQVPEVNRIFAERCECFALLDTLEYLVKGGCIGKVRATIGGLLEINPMIVLRDGEAREFGKERTPTKSVYRL